MSIFDRLESEVRGYCRSWPVVFKGGEGHRMFAEDGTEYLDFFAGAGALNYGHNHPAMIDAMQRHLSSGGFVHALDISTTTKAEFLETFEDVVLKPRNLDYKVQFPGPTGTNAVEAALKLARKVTGREKVLGFTNGYHGMTLGSLAVTGNASKREGAGVPLGHAQSVPFDGYLGEGVDTLDYLEAMLVGDSSGMDLPAAVIVETTQGEGGINPAGHEWMRRLDQICKTHGILLVVDDIQVGCGRTGPFFSWERMGIDPDIVTLSKSISGSGLPMALVLMKPEHDLWSPGEHNGTFRGNNLAFATATVALRTFWTDDEFTRSVEAKSARARAGLERIAEAHPGLFTEVRGRGLILGVETTVPEIAPALAEAAFKRQLVIETAGAEDEVVKLLPPLIIPDEDIDRGLQILADCVDDFDEAMVEDLRAERDGEGVTS